MNGVPGRPGGPFWLNMPMYMRAVLLVLTLAAVLSGGTLYAAHALTTARSSHVARTVAHATPSAAEFGSGFVDTANAYASTHGTSARLAHPDCVQASPAHYMCSYAVLKPGRPPECHLMQARWTPEGPSTYTVTLAGRAARCGTIREALQSLQ